MATSKERQMNQAGVRPNPVTRRSWSNLSDRSKTAVLVLASIQMSLAVTAWIDLARRPASLVRGRKVAWAAVIAVDFVGPALYFRLGLVPDSA
jgi:hypothetical protein